MRMQGFRTPANVLCRRFDRRTERRRCVLPLRRRASHPCSSTGYLAKPADQYPSVFGHVRFFHEYPYFLPCAVGGAFNLAATVVGFLFLEEASLFAVSCKCAATDVSDLQTLPTKQPSILKKLSGTDTEEQSPIVEPDPPPPLRALLTRQIVTMLFSFGLWAGNNAAWASLVPLFSYTRVRDGGLGLSLNEIGGPPRRCPPSPLTRAHRDRAGGQRRTGNLRPGRHLPSPPAPTRDGPAVPDRRRVQRARLHRPPIPQRRPPPL